MTPRYFAPSTTTITRLLAPQSPCPSYRSFLQSRLSRKDHIRSFSITKSVAHQNHYQVLGVSPDCTKAELKKHFYTLSKETHPDRHPNDSNAGKRFAQISESYSTLSDPEKRRKYDRDHIRAESHGRTGGPGHRGSYAGSRPASGLSRRRNTFRGPPPSYYAHVNPTASSARQASETQTSGESTGDPGSFDPSRYAEAGPEFDPTRVFRTQTQEDARRQTRRQAELAKIQAEVEAEDGEFWTRFIVVSGMILIGVTVGGMMTGMGNAKGGLLRADGSRRDGATKNDWTKG